MTIEACADLGGFFREVVSTAMERQKVEAEPETCAYVTAMLVNYSGRQAAEFLDKPMVMILDEAMAAGPGTRLLGLQSVGDGALCLTGLFGEHLARAKIDPGYYVHLGRFAYLEAAGIARKTAGSDPVALIELGENFPKFVDVLTEVAESAALGSVTKSLVQLYDRYKSAGSLRSLDAMARLGVFPASGVDDES